MSSYTADIGAWVDEVRADLAKFYGWPERNVARLNRHELAAWRRHLLALRALGWTP